jgi:predicted N-formylglutamate amidohydrolase
MASDAFLITCEHGGNRIPAPYRRLFRGYEALLKTHRGYDFGALTMARELAASFAAPLVASTVSRLLVDLNRSLGHPQVFSSATRAATESQRAQIVEKHYLPYRLRVEHLVGQAVSAGRRVVHLSAHSYTPELDGHLRRADVGLLYDPCRSGETALCARWKTVLNESAPDLRVRRNYPYAGKGDGLTAHLRGCFASEVYLGVELEVNQAIVLAGGRCWTALRGLLADSLRAACAG